MSKKILVLTGSARKDGNSNRMAVMRDRLDQVANPFVIGEEGYIRFTGLYRHLAEDKIAAGVIDYTKG